MSKNICKNCKHLRSREDGPRAGIWYNLTCGAVTREKDTDFVTGEEGYKATNSLGGAYITNDRHPYARDINPDGECILFEEPVTLSRRLTDTLKGLVR